ncbi:hypothetical protein AtEden1_Chr4g0311281 [Arabidopsis thaliana]
MSHLLSAPSCSSMKCVSEQCCLIRACRPFASRGLTLMLGFTPSPLTI